MYSRDKADHMYRFLGSIASNILSRVPYYGESVETGVFLFKVPSGTLAHF